jgi:hypothetical protein
LATDVPTRLAWAQAKERGHVKLQLKAKKARVTRGGWELPSVFFPLFFFFFSFLAKLISPKMPNIILIKRE